MCLLVLGMKTSSAKSSNSAVNSTKNKKGGREREKRKSQTTEKNEQPPEKGSPTKDASSRIFAGIGPDSILIYSEQSSFEQLSGELCLGLAEDISYRLRYVIHDALTKARLLGRNCILSSDIDATFENLGIEKVLGATNTPNWICFGEQNLYYLDDTVVNLIELAEQENSYLQPANPIVIRKWSPDVKDVSKPLRRYFETMCFAVVSSDVEIRQAALKDLRGNNFIGPVIEWFYHFGYFLLSKDITYDSLTLCALDLIRTLEENVIATQIVSEKQLKLLVRLILQRLLRSATTTEVLRPMCRVLAILCDRLPLRELVTMKIMQKMPEIKLSSTLPMVMTINELGRGAIYELLAPNLLDYYLTRIEQERDPNMVTALLASFNYISSGVTNDIYEKFYEVFGDSLIQFYKIRPSCKAVEKPETNWRKSQLLNTRRKLPGTRSKRQSMQEAFPDYEEREVKPKIKFKFKTFNPATGRERFINMRSKRHNGDREDCVIVGKRTVLYNNKTYVFDMTFTDKCCDHTTVVI